LFNKNPRCGKVKLTSTKRVVRLMIGYNKMYSQGPFDSELPEQQRSKSEECEHIY
jgi:hypothetical protein